MGPLLLLWPLPLLMARGVLGHPTALLTSPGGEGAVHLWTWWAASQEGHPLGFHTNLLNYPFGLNVQVIDPLHGAIYLLGDLVGGPAFGWGLVCWLGLAVSGLGALMLAREADAPPVDCGWRPQLACRARP